MAKKKKLKTETIILEPGHIAILLPNAEALQAIEDGLSDAETFTGTNFYFMAFNNATIIRNILK